MSDRESIERMIDGGWAWAPTRSPADLPAPLDNDGDPHALSAALQEMREDRI